MKFKIKYLVLLFILVLAFALRFYKLDSYPALNADEAAIGYNAYSLLLTGKDEHGNPWPIHFQSFNDYKPGLYFYMVLPFVKLIGLNEWAVRIPGAFLGVLTVLLIYLLSNKLFPNKRAKIFGYDLGIGEIAAFLLAISPWHIHFSRGGWEVNVATFFMALGVLFFVGAVKNRKFYNFALCTLSFALAMYTYHAARVVVPLLGAGFLIFYLKDIKKSFKYLVLSVLIGVAVIAPLANDLLRGGALSRAGGVGLFADTGPRSRIEEQRGQHEDSNGVVSKLIHNKATNYGLAFLFNWTKHYWGEFLFLSGDEIQRNKVPETGQMYLFDIVFVAFGVIVLIKRYAKESGFILWWLAVAPVAAALTFQAPHALRAHNMVIPLTIISAAGVVYLIEVLQNYIKPKYIINLIYLFLICFVIWNFGRYLHMYWVHMAKEYTFSSQYGVKELVDYLPEVSGKYSKILVTDRYDQPYILFLFYMKYDPAKFQANHELTLRDNFGFSTVNHFDKYVFTAIRYDEARPNNPNSLIIGTDEDIPKEANIIKNIHGSNGHLYFQVVAN